jgi:hypothetical protein
MRTYCYGYRSSEIPSLQINIDTDPDCHMIRYTQSQTTTREVVQTSLGCHVHGAALPHVDPSDSQTVLDGIKKRIAISMPKMLPGYRRRFRRFVQKWCTKNLKPLSSDCDLSLDHWLENTHYPLWRKEELREKFKKIINPKDPKYLNVKSFIKDETYNDFKHARTINSRTDEFKCLVGPYIKLVEKSVMTTQHFIKFVPKKERPRVLLERFYLKYKYIISTDFASFEAHFIELLEDVSMQVYSYMFRLLPTFVFIMSLLDNGLMYYNKCIFKWVTVLIWRRRMSGEMDTSLMNGLTNLLLLLFVMCEILGQDLEQVLPFVEGDDGIFGTNVLPPDKQWLYDHLGLDLKLEVCEDLADASFCGNVFDPKELVVVTDPREVLASFGWTSARYARSKTKRLKELLRSKAMSLAWEYTGCPVLQSLANYALRVTSDVRAKAAITNEYEREQLQEMMKEIRVSGIPNKEPPKQTRLLVERLYGISVHDQFAIEAYFNEKSDLLRSDRT